ncbi:MAG: hypothetical protein LBD58_02950 [Treponema sp.]|nr:hypothetical protein [Treponema sp.]
MTVTESDCGSLKINIRYGKSWGERGGINMPPTRSASMAVETYTDFAGYDLSWIALTDYDNPQASYENLPAEAKDFMAANGIMIHVNSNGNSAIDISLRHIHLRSDISRETVIDRFRVVHVHGYNGHHIRTGDPGDATMANELIIFYKKYSGTPVIIGTV